MGRQRHRLMNALLRSRTLICHYCGEAWADSCDHIIPTSRGGCDAVWNLMPSCVPCNRRRGSQLPVCPCGQCQGALRRHLRLWNPAQPMLLPDSPTTNPIAA